MMIPAGNTAKLVRVPDPANQDFRISSVCDRLKLTEPTPVIILAGAMGERAGKTLAGVCRAAVRSDAAIIDSGLGSGIEKFCLRKHLALMGVAPDKEVIYPRINPVGKKNNELTNGHTQFLLLGDCEDDEKWKDSKKRPKTFFWGDEAQVKLDLAKRLAAGRPKKNGPPPCKIVMVLVGDNALCHKEVEAALAMNIPTVILDGSPLASKCMNTEEVKPEEMSDEKKKKLTNTQKEKMAAEHEAVNNIIKKRVFRCPDSSEELAAIVHLLLTVTI